MQAVVNSLVVNYEKSGSGKAVLLLHGWADDHRTFNGLTKSLSKRFQVIRLDLPGFGQSQIPPTAWDLSDFAAFLQSFVTKLGFRPYAIIGHSNGGALAMHALASRLVKADRLVLLAPSGVRDTRQLRRLGLKIIAKAGKFATLWLPSSMRRRLRRGLYGAAGSDMFVTPHLQEAFRRIVRQDVQSDAAKLSLPTLIIYGSEDKATPVNGVGRRLHELIVGSRLEIVPGADHFVHRSGGEAVLDRVEKFL
jgi:pimeloyl-ACP methyl ester carboxylesterase